MSTANRDWLEQDSAWVLGTLLTAHPEIATLRLFRPSPPLPLQERAQLSASEWAVVERGLALRRQTSLPFWDSVFVSSFESEGPIDGIVEAASFHNVSTERVEQFERGENVAERLRSRWAEPADRGYLAVSSSVELTSGRRGHIPLLDFHIPPSAHGLRLVHSVLEHAKVGKGYVLLSGKSYHYYGEELLDQRGLTQMLARCLLYAPVIDRAWVAHQLLESACALRISPKVFGGEPPLVVARVS